MGAVCLGFLMVAVDVRVGGFDVLPNVIGWAVIAFSLYALRLRDPLFEWGSATATVAALLALFDIYRRPVPGGIAVYGKATANNGWGLVAALVYALAIAATGLLICLAVAGAASRNADKKTENTFGALAAALVGSYGLGALVLVIGAASGELSSGWIVLYAGLGLVANVALFVSLFRSRNLHYLNSA